MPRGVPLSGPVHCKLCPDSPAFKTISKLRTHQWSEHRESYITDGKKNTSLVVAGDVAKAAKVLTVPELIEKIEAQKRFLEEHLAFLRGWVK